MRYLFWFFKILVFVAILSFVVKNMDVVTIRYYLGYEWQAPLVFVLLVFFCIGVVVGIVANFARMFRQRREIIALKRELRVQTRGSESAGIKPDIAPGDPSAIRHGD